MDGSQRIVFQRLLPVGAPWVSSVCTTAAFFEPTQGHGGAGLAGPQAPLFDGRAPQARPGGGERGGGGGLFVGEGDGGRDPGAGITSTSRAGESTTSGRVR